VTWRPVSFRYAYRTPPDENDDGFDAWCEANERDGDDDDRSDFDAYVEDAELDAARTEVEDRAQQAYYDHDHNYWP
jgi:hypothetical protein